MGIPILVLGESGTGKSASLRNFKPEEVGVVNVCGKPLPFRSSIETFKSDDYLKIEKALKASLKKVLVIETASICSAMLLCAEPEKPATKSLRNSR